MQLAGNDNYQCQYVYFSRRFPSFYLPVRVFTSVNHGNDSAHVHNSILVWVEDVSVIRFKACTVAGGQGSGSNITIDWLAFQGYQPGVKHGQARFALFTTGTKCTQVTFSLAFSMIPEVQATIQHGNLDQRKDAMNVWIESISKTHFVVCLRESRTFDGPHSNLVVNWMAYEHYPRLWKVKQATKILFSNYEIPLAKDNYALCKTINFVEPFYEPPNVLTTAVKDIKNNSNPLCAVKGPLLSWAEDINRTHFRVCIKDYAGIDGQRDNLEVHYVVIGDYHPCNNASCDSYRKAVALSSQRCECLCESGSSCPSYQEEICASNGRTFRNLCFLKKEICETRANYTHYHPGSCSGFPLQKGRHQFKNHPSWAKDQCETIQFSPFIFYPHQKIFVQLTVNHVNYSDQTYVHEATTPWVESVNSTQFTACVARAGRNDYPSGSVATVDWVAYQGAPPGGIAGEKNFSRWWSETSCQTVTLPSGKFSSQPTVFATAEHYRSSLKHDATSVWLEDVSALSFKICIRELQNFVGVHDDISVNWLAFETLHRPFFSEHDNVSFPNEILPSKSDNFAFCQDVNFTRKYNNFPIVILTAMHSSGGGNTSPECNGIVSWIEFISNARFRICVKELFLQRFDPVTVSYAVLADICPADWIYFKGYCYRKVSSSCDSWSNGQSICTTLGAHLPSVHSQEENVFLQNLYNAEKGWLGLSDINREGTFNWSDGTPFDFHYWAMNQPNNFRNEDCVHTLGSLQAHKYKWNDVNCSNCHRYSCKKDFNECQSLSHDCPKDSICNNTDGSYTCQCQNGSSCPDYLPITVTLTTNGRKGRYGVIQRFTIPNSGRYKIRAWGARGGTHSYNYGYRPGTYYGGRGAFVEGTFTLNKGTVLNIVVGQRGGDSVEVKGGQSTTRTAAQLGLSVEDNAGTGGGGGTFVYTTLNVLLLAAGGGGGASGGYNGVDGQAGTRGASSVGQSSSYSRNGGTGGMPGQCNSAGGNWHGGVGAGWLAQGCARAGNQHGERGGSRAQGWVGGRAGRMNSGYNGGPPPGAVGGFGGGGGGSEDNGASGGGGGYSGGGSGTYQKQAGGGGGSYCGGASCRRLSGKNLNDDGMVQIVKLSG
ncbi:uncharacterized protein [Montipora foliosa]